MYPGTIVNWYDESAISNQSVTESTDFVPIFLTASSFDKGPEDMRRVSANTFYDLYGTHIYFNRHGQAAIQAANIVDAGGELLIKRVVAPDATLDNLILCVTLGTSTTQATDDEGNLLYLDDEGNETTEVTSEIVVASTSTTVKWSASAVENCTTPEEVVEQAMSLLDEDAGVYPVIVVTDNGRGDTGKAFRLSTNREVSITLGREYYTAASYEGTSRIESTQVTLGSYIYNNVNYSLDEFSLTQLKCFVDSDVLSSLITAIAESLGVEESEVWTYDLATCKTVKGKAIDGLELDADSVDITATYGIELEGGTNGEFGTKPVNTEAWEEQLLEFFDGDFDNAIYDLDENYICFCLDANYPYAVKEAIAQLVTFREDFYFFRDMRLDADSYSTALDVQTTYFETYNKFIGDYMTWYKILDPYTRKRISVTMMYDMGPCLVNRYNNGIYNPTAGIANEMILENAIEGTLNFVPRITPIVNQKELLDDARINYAIFWEGQCIVQSLYTSQESYTQLSYANNVMAIQEVVRNVRRICPKKRYTFVDGSDFTKYAEAVQEVLANYTSNFDQLNFIYTQDTLLASQKIFYATIQFAFKNWAQTEIFDVYAIANETISTDE